MEIRFSNFKGHKYLTNMQNGKTTKVSFELTQRAMLTHLTDADIRNIQRQCMELLKDKDEKTIFLSGITTIEEVTNE